MASRGKNQFENVWRRHPKDTQTRFYFRLVTDDEHNTPANKITK